MVESLKNKTVLITGASSGIGKETALKFAAESCNLILTYNKGKKEAELVEKECRRLGAKEILFLQLNVSDSKQIQSCLKKVLLKFKSIDYLINNAGILVIRPFQEQSEEEIHEQLHVNLLGQMLMTKYFLPHVKEGIVTIASGAGMTAYAELSVYCATKFGLRGFTQAIAQELPNLRIFCVNPGTTATRMTSYHGTPVEKVAEVIVDAVKGKIPAKSGDDVNVWEFFGKKEEEW